MAQNQSFMQVATDGSGKRVGMDLITGGALSSGSYVDLYLQQAEIVGDVQEALHLIRQTLAQMLAVNRAMLAILQETSTASITEDDMTTQTTVPKE